MLRRILLFFSLFLFANTVFADPSFIARPDVRAFIQQMVKQYHFNQQELLTVFDAIKIRPSAVRSLKAPLEKKPWYLYRMLFVTDWRTREGVLFWDKYQEALARAEKTYGVPASIIVATIGIETKYGTRVGDYHVIDALASIAFSDSPRANYFRNELREFLLLTREENLDPLKVMGSYAGAIGPPQFMPSSYRNYAVDFSGNGKVDLTTNIVDVIGSVANYYQKHGWQYNQIVTLPAATRNNIYLSERKAKLIELEDYFGKEYWLGFHNFQVIKRYNTSDLYAMAVYQLSTDIAKLREKKHNAN